MKIKDHDLKNSIVFINLAIISEKEMATHSGILA